ncbi:MAG: hypothetical protein JXQ71_12725 [Verrucomicrobia bacterium]|nr:hypothetical protein [Verrucomicrobiota bacterium]
MNAATKTWVLVVVLACPVSGRLLSQDAVPPPAPAPRPAAVSAPAAPPAAPPAGEVHAATAYHLRRPAPPVRRLEYDGALMRLRSRARRDALTRARNAEEAKWREGVDNVSFDPMTGRPMGVHVLVIRY